MLHKEFEHRNLLCWATGASSGGGCIVCSEFDQRSCHGTRGRRKSRLMAWRIGRQESMLSPMVWKMQVNRSVRSLRYVPWAAKRWLGRDGNQHAIRVLGIRLWQARLVNSTTFSSRSSFSHTPTILVHSIDEASSTRLGKCVRFSPLPPQSANNLIPISLLQAHLRIGHHLIELNLCPKQQPNDLERVKYPSQTVS
jgi:hypothetical protein